MSAVRTISHAPAGRFGTPHLEARADSTRLDWLETFAESIDRYRGPRWRVWSDEHGLVEQELSGPNLRAAIDAAMAAMEEMDA